MCLSHLSEFLDEDYVIIVIYTCESCKNLHKNTCEIRYSDWQVLISTLLGVKCCKIFHFLSQIKMFLNIKFGQLSRCNMKFPGEENFLGCFFYFLWWEKNIKIEITKCLSLWCKHGKVWLFMFFEVKRLTVTLLYQWTMRDIYQKSANPSSKCRNINWKLQWQGDNFYVVSEVQLTPGVTQMTLSDTHFWHFSDIGIHLK